MTSNIVKSVNTLTKDVRKLPITSLMDWFRDLLRKWYYERRAKHQDASDDKLIEWATAKVKRRMLKSNNWTVKGVHERKVNEIREHKKHAVYLEKGECTCQKWQLSGLPCSHKRAMARFAGLRSVAQLEKPWFLNRNLKGTYAGIIYLVRDVSSWHTPDDFLLLLPSILGKNLPGRSKKKDCIPSQGEGWKNNKCGRCGSKGHNRMACNVPVPKNQTTGSKRIKSTNDLSIDSQPHQDHQQPNQGYNVQMMYEPQPETNNIDAMYQTQQEFQEPYSSDPNLDYLS
ncbi:transposase, MuDR, MULE transposase domain protein [Tanacetum coccineum]